MENVDWGLIVAIIAMIIGLGSLYLTWQSIKATKKSIKTSFEIYENQKKDENNKKKLDDKNTIKAIRNAAANELILLCDPIIQIFKLKDIINSGVTKISSYTLGDTRIVRIFKGNEQMIKNDVFINVHANEIPINIILKSSILDKNLYHDLSNLNSSIDTFKKQINFCFGYIDYGDPSLLNEFMSHSDFYDLINSVYNLMKVFSDELKYYKGYHSLKEFMEKIINNEP